MFVGETGNETGSGTGNEAGNETGTGNGTGLYSTCRPSFSSRTMFINYFLNNCSRTSLQTCVPFFCLTVFRFCFVV